MPTIGRIGPYRVFFYSKENFHPHMFTSNGTTPLQSFGWTLSI